MKRKNSIGWLTFVAGLLLLAQVVWAAVPSTINYQGALTDSTGTVLAGNASITFRVFNVVTGGAALWTETQTVAVTAGIYAVQLGSVTSLSGLDFSVPYWLEVEVGGETLTPRQALNAVP